jgi:hypothetical protein
MLFVNCFETYTVFYGSDLTSKSETSAGLNLCVFDDIYLTAIGLILGDISTHLHTNSTQDTENGTYITVKKNLNLIWEVRAVPRLCELYPSICLATEEQTRENIRVAARTSQADSTVQEK